MDSEIQLINDGDGIQLGVALEPKGAGGAAAPVPIATAVACQGRIAEGDR
jgi:hypothetical protein